MIVPWLILCVFGVLLAVPVVFGVGLLAGAAQADWMSDGFVVGLVFVLPTVLALTASEFFRRKIAIS